MGESFFGITITDIRKRTFQVACAHGINNCRESAISKQNLVLQFYEHTELSLRSPEPTSIGRMKGFNKIEFFDKYYYLIEEHGFTADKIYNMDKTGHSTLQTPSRVISTKGK